MALFNHFKTAMLLALLTALFLGVGSMFGRGGLYFAIFFVGIMNFGSYYFSDKLVLKMYKAKQVTEQDAPRLYNICKELSQSTKLPMPKVYIIPDHNANAFATGRNPQHAAVAATQGILELLTDDELKGVIAHEFAHIKNRDILISTVVGTIAGVISYIGVMAQWSALFGGFGGRDRGGNMIQLLVMAIITPLIAAIIQMAISRSREYAADHAGAHFVKDGESLASALEKLEKNVSHSPMRLGNQATAHLFISNPFRGRKMMKFLSTHPSTKERTRRLRNLQF